MLPALAEARIVEFNTQVRPALPDNLPAIRLIENEEYFGSTDYRHGFLLTPTVVEDVSVLISLIATAWPTRA